MALMDFSLGDVCTIFTSIREAQALLLKNTQELKVSEFKWKHKQSTQQFKLGHRLKS